MTLIVRTFVSSLIGFIAILIGQGLAAVYTSDNGWYIASRFPSDGARAYKLDIYNHSSDTINNLYMIIPGGLDASALLSSAPVQIENAIDARHEAMETVVSVSLIPPRRVTTILIPSSEADVRLLNADEKGLTQEEADDLDSPVRAKAIDMLIGAASFAVILGLLLYAAELNNEKRIAWLTKQLEREDQNHKRMTSELKETKEEIRDVRSSASKVNLMLMSRLRDYAKELEFWRGVIKDVCRRLPDADAEKMLEEVTSKLKTYGTRTKQPDVEHVKTLAEWIANEERRNEGRTSGSFEPAGSTTGSSAS